MLFNSLQFALFFPLVTALYFLLPHRTRWAFLLAASYFFYMAWEPGYVVLLWFSTAVDYLVALRMGRLPNKKARCPYLILSLITNLGLLFFFKYYNFFADSLHPLLAATGYPLPLPHSPFLLPVGISFYTFQTLSYTIEVYRGAMPPEPHLGRFALYVAFFPQLVAGPIERAQRLLPQLQRPITFDYARVTDGLRLMGQGLFIKVVIADRLANAVEHVYSQPAACNGPTLALATFFFAFQIYCDFAGYSSIAIGAARILGIDLMENFRRPYFAASCTEFWRRWHISLSTWFRDYLYIPLGGNRSKTARWMFNILVVFTLSGLWHGAHWTFLIWGLLHGFYLITERRSYSLRQYLIHKLHLAAFSRLRHCLALLTTFLLTCFAWIFFRAASLQDALLIIRGLPKGWYLQGENAFWHNLPEQLGIYPHEFQLSLVLLIGLIGGQALQETRVLAKPFPTYPGWLRWGFYMALFWGILLFGILRQKEFYYFVF